jgi:hypothetical protein
MILIGGPQEFHLDSLCAVAICHPAMEGCNRGGSRVRPDVTGGLAPIHRSANKQSAFWFNILRCFINSRFPYGSINPRSCVLLMLLFKIDSGGNPRVLAFFLWNGLHKTNGKPY